ncbi:MAG: hypothetical protein A2V93_10660 [Ignavibacteria bacterium RBG_16_34_14]|nr:MAG: hypothetical protein A2V93_10660 [Ignavibacteria bacterium RBG_16_34_14]
MSFYYQSTIIYFIVFVFYVIIRGKFVEGSFKLITKDPIIYLFGVIVFYSLVSLLYNIYKNRHLEISDEEISFVNKFRSKSFRINDIKWIRISRKRKPSKKSPLRLIGIKIRTRRRLIVLRPSDYENTDELLIFFNELKARIEKK